MKYGRELEEVHRLFFGWNVKEIPKISFSFIFFKVMIVSFYAVLCIEADILYEIAAEEKKTLTWSEIVNLTAVTAVVLVSASGDLRNSFRCGSNDSGSNRHNFPKHSAT